MTPLDLSAVAAAVADDATDNRVIREGEPGEGNAITRVLIRSPLYLALARAVLTERAAAEARDAYSIMVVDRDPGTAWRGATMDDLYHAADDAHAAVTAALAALAEG